MNGWLLFFLIAAVLMMGGLLAWAHWGPHTNDD